MNKPETIHVGSLSASIKLNEEKGKMQINKKILSIIFVGILSLSIAIPLFNLPSAEAQTGVFKNTFPLVGALPNPVGIGQQTSYCRSYSATLLQPDGME
jgi:hypothetical protein